MDTVQWFRQVNEDVRLTDGQYAALYRPGLKVWPVPAFGRLEEAQVLTLGVNPSCGEFHKDRWGNVVSVEQQADRLTRYFENRTVSAHPWFDEWETTLNVIGTSYRPGKKHLGAHIDLSPRATKPMGSVESGLFLKMIGEDLKHCVAAIERAKRLKFVMMAGSVTGKYYINEYLQEFLPRYGARLEGRFRRIDHPGQGKVFHHGLFFGGRLIPVFFCSSSPSSRAGLLQSRVHAERSALEQQLI